MSLWIHKSIDKSKKLRDHYKMHEVDIFIKDALPEHVDVDFVFSTIPKKVPSHLLSGVDIIYVGQFDVFKEKEVNAVYQDGAIYVTNNQSNEMDMIDDIIHETAHAVEEEYKGFIYDDQLEVEFVGKRKRLFDRLTSGRSGTYYKLDLDLKKEDFFRLEYDEDFDKLLYQDLGYSFLYNLTYDLFVSPYGATSLQEYWANGFENYFIGDPEDVRKISPVLYNKISTLATEL